MTEQEQMKDAKHLEEQSYTRARERQSQTELHHSAPTDHAGQNNHIIDWKGVRLPAKEPDYTKRGKPRSYIYPENGGEHDQPRKRASFSAEDLHQAALALPLTPDDSLGIENGNTGFAKNASVGEKSLLLTD